MVNDIEEIAEVKITRDPYTMRIVKVEWQDEDGFSHNPTELPSLEYDRNSGSLIRKEWALHGLWARSAGQGPATINYDPDTNFPIQEIHYNESGLLHRTDGPAIVVRDSRSGEETMREFWINGEEYSEQKFQEATSKVSTLNTPEFE